MRSPVTRRTAPASSDPTDVVGADRLFREHSMYVAAFLRRLGIIEAAIEDAVQDVFLVAHTRGGYRPGAASARTWLGAITVRVAANARRARQRKRETAEDRISESCATSTPPDMLVQQRQELAHVERALGK